MEIFSPKNQKIVATLVVRDEEDILQYTLDHLLEQGITSIFATDNKSQDKTKKILEKCSAVIYLADSDDMTHNQEVHTTKMAREACKLKPDWIVHVDADEFWCGLGDIGDHHESALWSTKAFVHMPVNRIPKETAPLHLMKRYIDFHGHAREFKVIHRPDPGIQIKHGNHGVFGKSMGYCPEVYRHHYPIRSFSQFQRKVVQGATALIARGFVCERWYLWYDEFKMGRLPEIYNLLCQDWDQYTDGDHPDMEMLSSVLTIGYKVTPETAKEIFQGLSMENQQPVIREWLPSNYHFKPRLLL